MTIRQASWMVCGLMAGALASSARGAPPAGAPIGSRRPAPVVAPRPADSGIAARQIGRQPPMPPSPQSQTGQFQSVAQQVDAAPTPLQPGSYDPAKISTRYRYHNGLWWFWLPSQQWAFWNGGQWVTQRPRAYQEWRLRQFGTQYDPSAAREAMARYRDVDRWRQRVGGQAMGGTDRLRSTAQADADYHRQIDRFHDQLMTTPYDYRIGTPGHGLFDADPDRVISQSGRLNYATSTGGYMGGALRGPFGY